MRVHLALGIIGLSLLSPGCALVTDATHLLVYEANKSYNDHRERSRNRRWANAAWDEVRQSEPGHPYSDDYAWGFKEGFANYLYRGTPEPPPVAPPRYRTLRYQTPEGYRAVEDWFAGYRRGVDVAQKGGYRQWITGPSALRVALPTPLEVPGPVHPAAPPPPAEGVLPAPQKLTAEIAEIPISSVKEEKEDPAPPVARIPETPDKDPPAAVVQGKADRKGKRDGGCAPE
jgi:hypothetical protein